MAGVANIEGLVQRKTGKDSRTWYYRLCVPQADRDRAGRNEIWVSLRTRDKSQAIAALPSAIKEAKAKLAKKLQVANGDKKPSVVASSNPDQIADVAARLSDAHYVVICEGDSIRRDNLFHLAAADELAFYKGQIVPLPNTLYMAHLSEDPETPLKETLSYYWWHVHGERVDLLKRSISAGDFSEGAKALDALSNALGLAVAQQSNRPILARAVMLAEIQALTDIKKQDDARYLAITSKTASLPSDGEKQDATSLPVFSVVARKWIEEKSRGAWSARRKDACEATIRLFLEILGDHSIDTYKKTHAREFKDVLCDLPPNRLKLKETRTLNVRAAAKKSAKSRIAAHVDY